MADSSLVTYEYYGPPGAHGGSQPSINVGVIHDVEAPTIKDMAESLCGPNYFGHGGDIAQGHPVSIHYVVGPDAICQGTHEQTIAWHVGNSNPGTIGIEQLGYASFTLAQWLDPEGQAQLHNLARLMDDISSRHPLIRRRWLSDSELLYALDHKSSPGGWTTHKQLSRIGRSTGHYDPGDNYPQDELMALVQGNPVPTPPVVVPPTVKDEDMLYQLICANQGNGAIFACAPGRFFHVSDPAHFDLGVRAGLWSGAINMVGLGDLDIIRDSCISNGADKGVNFLSVLPSDFVQGKVGEPTFS